MPLHTRQNNNGRVHDDETIDALLDVKHGGPQRANIPSLSELTSEQRSAVGLVKNLGTTCKSIPGDPYGYKHQRSGNVFHAEHPHMKPVMGRIFKELVASVPRETEAITAVRLFFSRVQGADIRQLCSEAADEGSLQVLRDDATDLTVTFSITGKTIRVKQLKSICHGEGVSAYNKSAVATTCLARMKEFASEKPVDRDMYRYLIAQLLSEGEPYPGPRSSRPRPLDANGDPIPHNPAYILECKKNFRLKILRRFWVNPTKKTLPERNAIRHDALYRYYPPTVTAQHLASADKLLSECKLWGSGKHGDEDFFWLADAWNEAAESDNVFEYASEDVCVVVDKNSDVVFASFERLVGELFGEDFLVLLSRAKNMWSFFAPMDTSASNRHISDDEIRQQRASMDMERCNVVDLQNAKMYIGSYGTWSQQGDGAVKKGLSRAYPKCMPGSGFGQQYLDMIPEFYKAFFGTASAAMRLMYENLAPAAFKTAVEVHASLPEDLRYTATDEDFGTFAVLADGTETNLHRDTNDLRSGYACMISGGEHTGGFLCLPEIGLKVSYKNGTTAMIRGAQLSHMVSRTEGERWFFVYVTRSDAKTVMDRTKASQMKRKAEVDDEDAGEKDRGEGAANTNVPAVGSSDGHMSKRPKMTASEHIADATVLR